MERVGIAIVGCGHMGRLHALVYKSISIAHVVAVCDANERAGHEVAALVGAEYYSDYTKIAENPAIKAVSVCLPDSLHFEPCTELARSGKDVLVEKPLADNFEDARAIIKTSRQAGTILMVGHLLRFDPRYYLGQQAIRAGRIGDIQIVCCRRFASIAAAKRIGKYSLPYSLSFFLGVHDFDILRWFSGSEVEMVHAVSKRRLLENLGYDLEDFTYCYLELTNGVSGVVELSWILPEGHYSGSDHRTEVIGTRGWMSISCRDGGLIISGEGGTSAPDTSFWPDMYGGIRGALFSEIAHFVDCVVRRTEPDIKCQDALAAVKIASMACESIKSGRPVWK